MGRCQSFGQLARPKLAKHDVDLFDAVGTLSDLNRIEDTDEPAAYGEAQTRAIGMTGDIILFLVTMIRDENLIRIIPAPWATRFEVVTAALSDPDAQPMARCSSRRCAKCQK